MSKKVMGMIAAALVLGAGMVSAQTAATAESATPKFEIHGQIMTEAWVGPNNKAPKNNGATLHDDGSVINFKYNFDEFSGAFIQINLGQLPGIENHFNGNMGGFNMDYLGDVKVWTDILGELGVKPVSLKLTLGKTDASSAWYAPGAMGVNDGFQGDGENDKLNWIIDIGLNKDIFPLVLTLSSDLDFGVGGASDYAYGGQSAWNNQGLSGFAQLASKGYANDSMSLDWNVYYGGSIARETLNNNVYKAGVINHHIGGTFGLGILGLPVNLKVGGAVEYFKHTEYSALATTGNSGVDWMVGVNTGVDNVFKLNAAFAGVKEYEDQGGYYNNVGSGGGRTQGYSLDDAGHAYGYIVGVDASFDMISRSSIYAGMNLRFGEGYKGDLNHRISYEIGYKFMPTDSVSLFTGWQKGRDHINARGYKEILYTAGADNHNVYTYDNAGRWYIAGSYVW